MLVIEATEGQSNGLTRAHVKTSGIKLVDEPTAEAIDIRADYVAKYGAPSAAVPKIFFRYYYVNSSTGEKSAPCWQKSSGPLPQPVASPSPALPGPPSLT